jgi:hypothetical protein
MTRLLLVLVCALFAFVIVTNVAPDLIPESLRPHQRHSAVDAPKASEVAKPKAKAPQKPAGVKADASPEPIDAAASVAPESPVVALTPTRSPRAVFSVSAERADLYVTNSTTGAPIRVLTNGEIVDPQYIINTAGQEWTFVDVADKKISGFMRSEDLARK